MNVALTSKDNFITKNMAVLEQLVDKTSMVRSESVRKLIFGDLDAEIEQEQAEAAKREKKEKKAAQKKQPT